MPAYALAMPMVMANGNAGMTAYLAPVPTRYVFVPCRVNGPGLHPKIRIILDDNCSTRGMNVVATDIVRKVCKSR